MCMQCMAGAMTAVAGASGFRAWLGGRVGKWSWLTPRRLKRITLVLLAAALLASSTLLAGTATAPSDGQRAAERSSVDAR